MRSRIELEELWKPNKDGVSKMPEPEGYRRREGKDEEREEMSRWRQSR